MLLALTALALVGLVVAPYLDQDGQQAGPPISAAVTDIVRDPDTFYDKAVAVSGRFTMLVERHGVTLQDDDPDRAAQFGGALLVISREPLASGVNPPGQPPFIAGDSLRVVGFVRRFVLSDIEREIGGDLSDADLSPWANQPVIVATTIARAAAGDPLDLSPVTPATPCLPAVRSASQLSWAVHRSGDETATPAPGQRVVDQS